MVGIAVGAGETARARRIAWISSAVGVALTGTIGVIVAVYPPLWLSLFSQNGEVLRVGSTYLRIVAPTYAPLGLGFVLAVAARRGPCAVAVRRLHGAYPFRRRPGLARGRLFPCGGMARLAGMVAASLIAYAAICSLIMFSRGVWRKAAKVERRQAQPPS
jgi:Na+-driven multidrug efflux pump